MQVCIKKMQINQINQLPSDILSLSNSAKTEGFNFLDRLIQDFKSDALPFSNIGEALFEIRESNNILMGIGGVTQDILARPTVGRLRRFYIHPKYRNLGIGSTLLVHIEHFAQAYFSEITLYTDTQTAALFYEKNGYIYAVQEQQTHHKFLTP